jgi:hypothetical protein
MIASSLFETDSRSAHFIAAGLSIDRNLSLWTQRVSLNVNAVIGLVVNGGRRRSSRASDSCPGDLKQPTKGSITVGESTRRPHQQWWPGRPSNGLLLGWTKLKKWDTAEISSCPTEIEVQRSWASAMIFTSTAAIWWESKCFVATHPCCNSSSYIQNIQINKEVNYDADSDGRLI